MKGLRVLVVVAAMALASGALAGWVAWQRLQTPYQGFAGAETFVDVPAGTPTAGITRRLVEAGVVQDTWTFRAALWWTGRARELKAGEYRFAGASTPLDVVALLADGKVYGQNITFPEGLMVAEMAALFQAKGLGTAKSFIDAARDPSAIAHIDPRARDLEGYLFPETYTLGREASASRLVSMMAARFRQVWTEVTAGRDLGGLTPRQLMALAALVEKETATPAERPLVSAVYRNRLRLGMGLQADPTVVYALIKAGRYNGNIRKVDLGIDSPYNTYRYPGLPPGPIAAPGRESIAAALAPADVPFLYFVSRNDGSHAFAETLREHNANVQRFQVEYFRRQRAAARAATRTGLRRP